MDLPTTDAGARVLVVGAGPVGLETAVLLVRSGIEVTLVDRANGPGSAVCSWKHVRLFSCNALNCSKWGTAALEELGEAAPDPAAYPTGGDYVDDYLGLLCTWLDQQSGAEVLLNTRVEALSRLGVLKNEQVKAVGETARETARFGALLVTRGADGLELELFRDDFAAVVDCSGCYGNGNGVGRGGAPALGERELRQCGERRPGDAYCWFDTLPDVLGDDRKLIVAAGGERAVALVGGGYSAATTLQSLVELAAAEPATKWTVDWLLRRPAGAPPYARTPDDPLPARGALVDAANGLAGGDRPLPPNLSLTVHRDAAVHSIKREARATACELGSRLALRGMCEEGPLAIDADVLICHTGYRPDMGLSRELQVHYCYASEGPMKLAGSLLAARVAAKGAGDAAAAGDCLNQAAPGPDLLRTPEPGFFILGAKSYGRNSAFLLRLGHAQAEAVVGILAAELPAK